VLLRRLWMVSDALPARRVVFSIQEELFVRLSRIVEVGAPIGDKTQAKAPILSANPSVFGGRT